MEKKERKVTKTYSLSKKSVEKLHRLAHFLDKRDSTYLETIIEKLKEMEEK